MSEYQIKTDGTQTLIHTLDVWGNDVWFTNNPENADYQTYLAWLAEGNEPEPWNG